MIRQRGTGSYSDIFTTSEPGVVIKRYRYDEKEYDKFKEVIEREICKYKQVKDSTFFPKFLGVLESGNFISGIMLEEREAALYNYINRNISSKFPKKKEIFEANCDRWVFQMLGALSFMKRENFVHGDISSVNICVSFPNQIGERNIKILDLGGCMNNGIGNHKWQCKGAIESCKPSLEHDGYSMGLVVWETQSGLFPGGSATIRESYKFKKIIYNLLSMKHTEVICSACIKQGQICVICAKELMLE